MERHTNEKYLVALLMVCQDLDLIHVPDYHVAADTRGRPRVD